MQKRIILVPFLILYLVEIQALLLVKRSLYLGETEPLFHQDRGPVLFTPRTDDFQSTGERP